MIKKEKPPEKRLFMVKENIKLQSSTIYKGVMLRSDAFVFHDDMLSIPGSFTFKDIPMKILEEVIVEPKGPAKKQKNTSGPSTANSGSSASSARISNAKI